LTKRTQEDLAHLLGYRDFVRMYRA